MSEIFLIMDELYRLIISDNLENNITKVKDIIYCIIELQKYQNITKQEYLELLEFVNLISIFNINDYELNRLLFEIRLILIKTKMTVGDSEDVEDLEYIYDQTMFDIIKQIR